VGPWLVTPNKIQFRRILVPTDLSENSMRVLPYVLGIAQQYQSSITFLNVIPLNGEASHIKTAAKVKVLDMEAMLRYKLKSFKYEFLVDYGDTAETILRVSREKNAELVALGIRNAFGGPHLRSSIAYRVIIGANSGNLTGFDQWLGPGRYAVDLVFKACTQTLEFHRPYYFETLST
jgi:nucleotide-binding universal stress UspA family protein